MSLKKSWEYYGGRGCGTQIQRESLSLVSYRVQEIKTQHTNSGQDGEMQLRDWIDILKFPELLLVDMCYSRVNGIHLQPAFCSPISPGKQAVENLQSSSSETPQNIPPALFSQQWPKNFFNPDESHTS